MIRTSRSKRGRHLVGAFHLDGEAVEVIVAAGPKEADAGQLWRERSVTVDELPRVLAELADAAAAEQKNAVIEWTVGLGGSLVTHEVVEIPARALNFPDAAERLEMCRRETTLGRVDSIEEAGCRMAHLFDGGHCVFGYVSIEALEDVARALPVEILRVTSEAGALLELFRKGAPEVFEPGAEPSIAMLCGNQTFAAVIVDRGEPLLLHQEDLVGHFRKLLVGQPSASVTAPAGEGELEFETGGGYSIPKDTTFRREPEIVPTEVETPVYQTALIGCFGAAVEIFRNRHRGEASHPTSIYLTGDAVTRHTILALFRRHFPSVAVEELLAARAVHIAAVDETSRARAKEVASRQNSLAGAIGLVAAASAESMLEFDLTFEERAQAAAVERGPGRARARAGAKSKSAALPKGTATALVLALVLAFVGTGARYAYYSHVQSDLAERIGAAQSRNHQLEAVKTEKTALETKMAHTLEILNGVRGMRARQTLPPQLLSIVEQSLPSGTRLDEISLAGGDVVIRGNSDDRENVPAFALALENRRDDFKEVVPATDQTVVKAWDEAAQADVDKVVYTFTIAAKYVRNVATDAERRLVGPQTAPVTSTGARPIVAAPTVPAQSTPQPAASNPVVPKAGV